MTREITNPLAAIVAAARKDLPRETGATATAEARRNRPSVRVVLADTSASMAEPAGSRRKCDVLADALAGVDGARIVAFSSDVIDVAPGQPMPPPSGGTALHLALDRAREMNATNVLVISDGHPDDARAASAAADRLDARIDVVYCGPEHDRDGMAFMRRLARGGGAARHHDLSRPDTIAAVRRLALPSPGQ